jgi:membrane fusion protein, multidrug efflux system
MQVKRWMVVTTLSLLLLGAGGYFGYKTYANKQAASGSADGKEGAKKADTTLALAAVDLAAAGPATLTQTLSVAGTVDAAKQAIVRSRHAGTATGMVKRAGDRVQAGERLARVDSDELRLRIAERESTIRQAQAQLSVAESARAQQRSLSDRGFISKAAFDAADSSFISARSAFENAKTQLDMAKSALAETVLTAPISGVISKRSVEPGERIGNEMAVFTIIDPSALEVVVPIAAERVAELKVGQIAKFQLDSGGTAINGTLTRIIPTTGSAARTVETRFSLPANSGVPAGAFLSGQLQIAQSSAPIAIPRAALKTDVNGNYVWAVQDGKARRLRVKIAPGSDGTHPQVPISEGLVAGATVLTLRGAEPNEGQLVAMPSAGVGAGVGAGAPASATPVNAATVAPAAVKS